MGRGLIYGNISSFAWRDSRKPQNVLAKSDGLGAGMWTTGPLESRSESLKENIRT
jgi:hypothetical protein